MVNRPTKGCFGREDSCFAVGVPQTGAFRNPSSLPRNVLSSSYAAGPRKPLAKAFQGCYSFPQTLSAGSTHRR